MFFAQNFESPATVLRNIFYITFLMLLKKKMYIKVIRDRERYKIKVRLFHQKSRMKLHKYWLSFRIVVLAQVLKSMIQQDLNLSTVLRKSIKTTKRNEKR